MVRGLVARATAGREGPWQGLAVGAEAPSLVVTAASGGAGATTLALHLALALRHRSPVVVDLAGGLAERLGFSSDCAHWGRALVPLGCPDGVRVLAAPQPFAFPRDPAGLLAAVPAGLVVADAQAGLAIRLPEPAAVVVAVARSRPGAERARLLLERLGPQARPVTLRRPPFGGATRAGIERLLGRPLAADLPYCPAMAEAEEAGAAVARPWSRWWWAVCELARRLEREAL